VRYGRHASVISLRIGDRKAESVPEFLVSISGKYILILSVDQQVRTAFKVVVRLRF
jgi:hypothetical protein